MKITILGCGAAGGVPTISQGWGRCDPANPKNRRRRPSILVEEGDTRVLVDSGPDLREQLIDAGVNRIDAVLYTHSHADHLHGIDDLREINRVTGGPIDAYGTAATLAAIQSRFAYVLDTKKVAADGILYRPWLIAHEVTGPFRVGALDIVPFEQDHGFSRSTGYRFGSFAYSTDLAELPADAQTMLSDLSLWIVDCQSDRPIETHGHVSKVLKWVEIVQPRRAILTHMGPSLDYDQLRATLPPYIEPGYDGMRIDLDAYVVPRAPSP